MVSINSQVTIGPVLEAATREEVKNEPMLFSCSVAQAAKLGGPLTQRFIGALPAGYWPGARDVIIDSRVHMLMAGWYPCIPGWHHDDVPRSRSDGQPNYRSPEYETRHIIWLAGDKVAPTEFALGEIELPEVPLGSKVYGEWSKLVDEALASGKLAKLVAPMHTLIKFNWQTFHQGVMATGTGWRFFIRASKGREPRQPGEVRRQVQVYMPTLKAGW